jgi:hypothetical protein
MVDGQINTLAAALQGTDDEDQHRIASTGQMTMTGRFRTRMMAAPMDLGDGDVGALRKSGAKAVGFAERLRAQIEGDARVIACDSNDFSVKVAISATLSPALAELAAVLRDAANA